MDRVKIQEIAQEAGASKTILIEKAKELDFNVKGINSTLTVEEAGILIDYVINNIKPPKEKKNEVKNIKLSINNLKSIKKFKWELNLKKGIKAIIGANGIGKSSFIIVLAKLIHPNVFRQELIGSGYKNTIIEYIFNDNFNESCIWCKPKHWINERRNIDMPKFNGYFESSILGGKRFRIYNNLKEIEVNEKEDTIIEASKFIRENMNYIMYGKNSEEERFKTLYSVSGKRRKKKINRYEYEIKEYNWYVLKTEEGHYTHEYFFSTGEYFLLSLLKFIEELVVNKNSKKLSMVIIDEIELSLHTLAQKRLVEKLTNFSEKYNILVIFTTHSLQIIEAMNPNDIYLFQNKKGICSISSPCYPGYLTSRLETHKYYDRIILVEDDLAEMFIIETLREKKLNNVLYEIIPIGGWEKVLETYLLNETQKFYGNAKTLVVLDGDMKRETKVHGGRKRNIKKMFLPLDNIERYVVEMIKNEDDEFISFIEKLIMPKTFNELNFYLQDDVLSKTNKIKDGYYHFIEAIRKEAKYYSEDEVQKRIINFILKQNSGNMEYQKFTSKIIEFING